MDIPGTYYITIGSIVLLLISSHVVAATMKGARRNLWIGTIISAVFGFIGWTAHVYLQSNADSANFAGSRIVLLAESMTQWGFIATAIGLAVIITAAMTRRKMLKEMGPKRETVAERKARKAREESEGGLESLGFADAGFPGASASHN